MNTWVESIRNAIEYIEQNLAEKIAIKDVAEKTCVSEYHFRRIFTELCGITVGEYIRNRRLSIAAQELSVGTIKVIDAAIKYGYESPDSFARAFARFHGIVPSEAREKGVKLREFTPLRMDTLLEGGTVMEYKIVEKAEFTLMGRKRRFDSEDSYNKIPENTKMWKEWLLNCREYKLGGEYNVEMYTPFCEADPQSGYCELWLPLEKA